MPKLILTVGLPGCGKTTWANQVLKKAKNKTVIVNLDDLRTTMSGGDIHSYKHNKSSEKYVSATQNEQAKLATTNKWDIIVADTNLNPKVQEHWRQFAKEHNYHFEIKDFFLSFISESTKEYPHDFFALKDFITKCKEQNLRRYESVPESVIDSMAEKYYYPELLVDTNTYDEQLPFAIIVDVDGTVAHMDGLRGPFEEHKVHLDVPDKVVIDSIKADVEFYKSQGKTLEVLIMSGRHDICYHGTTTWLTDNEVPFTHVHMRKSNDNRPDDIVKYELYRENVHLKYNIVKVYDDRDKVVSMWRNLLGLKVFQVAYGNF